MFCLGQAQAPLPAGVKIQTTDKTTMVLKLKTPKSLWVPSVSSGCQCRAWEVREHQQWGVHGARALTCPSSAS